MKKKTVKVTKNLQIDKETIAKLNDEQLQNVDGGGVINSLTCNTKSSIEEEDLAANSCGACSCNGTATPATT